MGGCSPPLGLRGVLALVTLTGAATVAAWTLEDTLQVATIPHAVPSPDGERVAYVVSRADPEVSPSVFRGQLFVAAADGSGARQFTFAEADVAAPRWSPDGAWLAYLRTPAGGPANLAIIRADGGGARPLTEFAEGVSGFAWSPNGRAIALLRPETPAGPETADAEVVGNAPPSEHLWHLPVDEHGVPGTPTRLTRGDFHVGNGLLDDAFDWSPDGRRIAFTRTRSAALDDWITADIAIVEIGSGRVQPFQQSDAAEFAPHYAPDGSRIAFHITMFPPSWIRQSRVALARIDGSGLKLLAPTPDEQPRIVGWISDRAMLVEEAHGTTTALWTLPADGAEPRRLDGGDAVLSAVTLNAPGTRLAFVTMDHDSPPEAAVTPLRRFRPVTVSAANGAAPALPAASTEVVRWPAADGGDIEGLLTRPAGAGDRRLPLVLLVHGGPAGVFQDDYLAHPRSMLPLAAFAAAGYATLRPNPRGSAGYGHAFRAANRGDWGGADHQDLMSGVDHLIERGLADPQRLAIAGWSYGGYLSALSASRTHRFAAVIAGAPVTDLLHLAVTTDIGGFVPDNLDGDFWTRPELYLERSPLRRADAITTPTLVLHGAADARVPAVQGLALFRALEAQGVATRMVRYPRAPHVLEEPRQIVHAAGEMLDWLARHVPTR